MGDLDRDETPERRAFRALPDPVTEQQFRLWLRLSEAAMTEALRKGLFPTEHVNGAVVLPKSELARIFGIEVDE